MKCSKCNEDKSLFIFDPIHPELQECMEGDDICTERLLSLLWDLGQENSQEEIEILEKKIGWAVTHIARFHPHLEISVVEMYYDIRELVSTTSSSEKKWFWYRKDGGRFRTVAEAAKAAQKKNLEEKPK